MYFTKCSNCLPFSDKQNHKRFITPVDVALLITEDLIFLQHSLLHSLTLFYKLHFLDTSKKSPEHSNQVNVVAIEFWCYRFQTSCPHKVCSSIFSAQVLWTGAPSCCHIKSKRCCSEIFSIKIGKSFSNKS